MSIANNDAVRSTIDVEVRYAETDQMGIVHHANYVVWLELARTNLCAKSGFHYADVERRGYLLTVTGVELRYAAPARYGEVIQVDCWIDRLTSRGVRFAYEVRRGEKSLARGATEHIWCRADTTRPCRAPEFLRQAFERMAGMDQDP